MDIKIVERPATTVVGLNIETQPMSPEIKALWPKFVARIPEVEGQSEPRVAYGVMRHPEREVESLEYMAGVAVRNPDRVPKGMTTHTLPAGSYAVFRYPLSVLGKGFGEIFNHLLPESDYVQGAGPLFERYDEAFNPADANSLVEIGIPVRRK